MNFVEYVQNAIKAEQDMVPVDWKSIALNVTNTASTAIVELEKKVEELGVEITSLRATNDSLSKAFSNDSDDVIDLPYEVVVHEED